MSFFNNFTVVRANDPDIKSIYDILVVTDSEVQIHHQDGTNLYRIGKETAWTGPQITSVTNTITNAPDRTNKTLNKAHLDTNGYPYIRAIILTLIDEINILRAQHSLPPRTPAQAIQAIKDKIDAA